MENQLNQNTRTLIVSFVVAIMALIPLRFIEYGQSVSSVGVESQVLGESVETENVAKIEAPYDKIDVGKNCVAAEVIDKEVQALLEKIDGVADDQKQVDEITALIGELEARGCN